MNEPLSSRRALIFGFSFLTAFGANLPLFAQEDEISKKIISIVRKHFRNRKHAISLDQPIISMESCGAPDSLDFVEIVMDVEKEFNLEIPDDAVEQLTTIRDLVEYINRHKTK